MKRLLPVLLIAVLAAKLVAKDEKHPLRLSQQEMQLLDVFVALKPGMTEEELRQRLPELSASYKEKHKADVMTAETSTFRLAGMEWHGVITLADGRLQKAALYAFAWKEPHPMHIGQALPQHEVRAVGLLIAAHYASKCGKVTEGYVPNLDCPAGNPFGLRHAWHFDTTALTVEFFKNSSTSSLEISIADWATWEKEQREDYGSEDSWPLKPAPKKLLLEVSRP